MFSAFNADKTYRSIGVLNATSGTLLSELTGSVPSFGYETTSNVTSRNINQLLNTKAFLDDVISRAGLSTALKDGQIGYGDVRGSISASPMGDNLIAVSASTLRPEQSQRLAKATLDAFIEYVVSNDIADASVRISTYEDIRDTAQQRFDDAVNTLNQYYLEHPTGDEDSRPAAEALEIANLRDTVDRTDEALATAETNVNDAKLASDVARTVVTRQLRTIDAPELPVAAEGGLRQAGMTVVMFGVLGTMVAAGALVLRAMLDRTIRSPIDVSSRFGVEVLAAVPPARRRAS
jgi:capsular polysaccharide biosynthesis protein